MRIDASKYLALAGLLLAAASAAVNTPNDPPEPAGVRIQFFGYALEGNLVEVWVYRMGDPNLAFTVDYSTVTNGTALPGVNFVAETGTVAFAQGETSKQIQIPTINNGVVDFALSFGVQLSNATSGVKVDLEASVSIQMFDRQYPTSLDWRFNPEHGHQPVAVAAEQANGQLLVADWVRDGQKDFVELVTLGPDGARLAEWPTVFAVNNAFFGTAVAFLSFLDGGKVLAAGAFTNVNGLPRHGMVRLNRDGSVDPAFNPIIPASSMIDSISWWPTPVITLPDGDILVVTAENPGENPSPRQMIRLDKDGRANPDFPPRVFDDRIWKMAVDDRGRLLVGGQFERIGGVARHWLARINPDGLLEKDFVPVLDGSPDGNGGVWDLAVQPDGKILIAGGFSTVNGLPRWHVARLNEDGTTDASFLYRTDAPGVHSVRMDVDGTVIVGGWEGLQRLAADGTRLRAVASGLGTGIISILSSKNGVVLASISEGDDGARLARLLLDRAPRTAIVISASDHFVAFQPSDTRLEATEPPYSIALPVTVRRMGDVTGPATVTVNTRDGTAKAGAHYVAINRTLKFAPFEQEITLSIETLADNVFDPAKTFELVLTGVSGVEAISAPVLVTINDGRAHVDAVKRMPDGGMEVTFYSPPDRNDVLETSPDLKTWSRVAGRALEAPSLGRHRFRMVDEQADDAPVRFYRLKGI